MDTSFNPFRLSSLPSYAAKPLEKLLSLTPLAEKYEQRPQDCSPEEFLDYTMQSLGCTLQLQGKELHAEIPEQGPTIVVANHPFGGIEGVMLTRALLAIRPDTKVLTNQMLSSIPELSPLFFGVDVLNKSAAHKNLNSVRLAANHLQNNGLLLVFPAGQVSAMSWLSKEVKDRDWNTMVGRLAKKYSATCLPIFIHGQNPFYFQLGGLIHKRVRTALLPRQLTNKSGKTIFMTVGEAIQPAVIRKIKSASITTDTLRLATDLLGQKGNGNSTASHDLLPESSQENTQELSKTLKNLQEYRLLSKDEFDVYCVPYDRLGRLFDVIAKAREITFRAAGEGTGHDLDSDQYDPHYYHLFLWDREKEVIAGGYRLGETDKIVAQFGVDGLYSRSLYKYDEKYIENLGPSLELGRSFIAHAYQKHPAALDMLWKGIGTFIANNPHYRTLFGCVSISSQHSEIAQAFISDAMMQSFRAEQKFLENVKPIIPLKVKAKIWSASVLASIQDIAVFNKLVGQCDPGKSIPVLLRHYLSLEGRFVGFTVNKGFNNALDGMIIVDLLKVPPRYLKRYLGKDGATKFLNQWEDYESSVQSKH